MHLPAGHFLRACIQHATAFLPPVKMYRDVLTCSIQCENIQEMHVVQIQLATSGEGHVC